MGRQIPRLSRGAGVAPAGAPQSGSREAESFGVWFARERRLRDISVEFVAARTKLPLERIHALEGDTAPLGSDGRSRALARTLARAIGADPEEASARLPGPVAPPSPEARSGRMGLRECDRETTTQNDVNQGIVNVVVGFAPLDPAEFVIIKIQQLGRPGAFVRRTTPHRQRQPVRSVQEIQLPGAVGWPLRGRHQHGRVAQTADGGD